MKNPLTYQINDKKPLNAENCAKTIEKNPPKHECARVVKLNLKCNLSIASIAHW